MNQPNNPRMPVIFFGHGSPMNAIENNRYTEAWRQFGTTIPKPKAILSVSAHWYTQSTSVTAVRKPRTIHDFGGFPQALFDIEYPAPGDPMLAARIVELLAPLDVQFDQSWGLDHGTWSVLIHAFPNADIPVVQLSIHRTQPASFHYDLGKRLAPLRDEGVLIVGSGNVVHNLSTIKWEGKAAPYEWATEFNREVLRLLKNRDHESLINYQNFGEPGRLSIPTPDHYLPLLYTLGLQRDDDALSVIIDGIELGSISMLSVAFKPCLRSCLNKYHGHFCRKSLQLGVQKHCQPFVT